MQKKILLLGGSPQQIVAIKKAKELGYYTIVCDYLQDNPGQYVADKFFLTSTTNKEAVLKIARDEKIDGILAYASDPAAPTAAYVSEKLDLPGNPYKSVDILCNKGKFREFLKENGFNTPLSKTYQDKSLVIKDLNKDIFEMPVMIKPVDSSGSKGVSKIDSLDNVEDKINRAFLYSRSRTIIIEEYVDMYGYQIAGDGMSIDGELVFRCFGNDHFNRNSSNPFVPIAASFPYNMPLEVHDKVHEEIQKLLYKLNMKNSTYNFDIRIDKNYNVYLMEVAPRSGGNYIPQVIKYMTGIDMVEYAIKLAVGDNVNRNIQFSQKDKFYSYFAVHSLTSGKLKKININPNVEKQNIVENHIVIKEHDKIKAFNGANSTLGILIMKFDSLNEMIGMMDNSDEWISVLLED